MRHFRAFFCVFTALCLILCLTACGDTKKDKYDKAVSYVNSGNYDAAIRLFEEADGYLDSAQYLLYSKCLKTGFSADYDTAISQLRSMSDFQQSAQWITYFYALKAEDAEDYETAESIYRQIPLFQDAQEKIAALPDKINRREYRKAEDLRLNGSYTEAENIFNSLGAFSDSPNKVLQCRADYLFDCGDYSEAWAVYEQIGSDYSTHDDYYAETYSAANKALAEKNYETALGYYAQLGTYKDCEEKYSQTQLLILERDYSKAVDLKNSGELTDAWFIFEYLNGYKDSASQIEELKEMKYQEAQVLASMEKFDEAIYIFQELTGYKDSYEQILQTRYQQAMYFKREGMFDTAIAIFSYLDDYSNAAYMVLATYYLKGASLREAGNWDGAVEAFTMADGYMDAPIQVIETRYQQGDSYYNNGDYVRAYNVFKSIDGYRDCPERLLNDENLLKAGRIIDPFKAIGSYVEFGFFEQDHKPDGKEPIEWCVLDVDGDKVLMISKYVLHVGRYASSDVNSWERSEMRFWLTYTFYNEAFTPEQKGAIIETSVNNGSEHSFGRASYGETQDNVFILSYAEVNKYLADLDNLTTTATIDAYFQAYKLSQNSFVAANACQWWLRSPGKNGINENNGYVTENGLFRESSTWAHKCGIRPVVWIDLNSDYFADMINEAPIVQAAEEIPVLTQTKGNEYSVGDVVAFGNYEQDNNLSNGKEPIEWIVIEKRNDGSLVLLSRYGLDVQPYSTTKDRASWATSTLRTWLNSDFCNAAFNNKEQGMIIERDFSNDYYGNDSIIDKIWVPSYDEAAYRDDERAGIGYFSDYGTRMCIPTAYAIAQGARQDDYYALAGIGTCYWHLRAPYSDSNVPFVRGDNANRDGGGVGDNSNCVRPAIIVKP